ncbi:3-hydroxyisobutyryl-CoA hydrolase [Acetobacter oeni LMG 21952]|nr:3-hydroxyisobutyryl-CoA hydrolase [Acetobacter oeni LMG 21952]
MTLDMPKKLNAIDAATAEEMLTVLDRWRDDADIHTVLLDSSSPRAFCAGGDIRAIRDIIARSGSVAAHTSMAIPYRTMLAIARYPKPVVTVMDGIAMGGGIGFGAHARHRIVTERSTLAMPETAIGLTPDAGGGWRLAHADPAYGLRFALTGARMNGIQAVATGFADHLLHSDNLPSLTEALTNVTEDRINHVLQELAEIQAGEAGLPAGSVTVYDVLPLTPAEGLPVVMQRLENVIAAGGDVAWAEGDLAALKAACPFSLHVTWLMQQKLADIEMITDGFSLESSAVGHMLARKDFSEGVRARVIDKDNTPVWSPASIAAVDADEAKQCAA